MTITVVYDNNAFDPRLTPGWGFAAWLEYGDRVLLFDTGADGTVLLRNMARLGLDPDAIDIVLLSHAHGDHTGGLAALFDINPEVAVYVPQGFSKQFKDQVRAQAASLVEVGDGLEILPGLWSTGQMGTGIIEQALVAKTARGLVVVTGCAHPGVDRMVGRATELAEDEPYLVLGGFHLGSASRGRILDIIDQFRQLGVQRVAPGHCTGDRARGLFREAYGADYEALGAGWQVSVGLLTEPYGSEGPIWEAVSEGIPAQVGVAALAITPRFPDTVYLAAYEPGGLYRSVDGGQSWEAANGGLASLAPLAVAVHPEDPNEAWVGTAVGGYHTIDGGKNWQTIRGLPRAPLYALAVAADGSSVCAGGEALGVWCSDDGGQSWVGGEPAAELGRVLSLLASPHGTLFAGTAGQGIWASKDGGRTWRAEGAALAFAHVTGLAAAVEGGIFALADGNLYLRPDGGRRWDLMGPPAFEALAFALEPWAGGRLYLGGKGGQLAVSSDLGASWSIVGPELRHADITVLVADPAARGVAYLGTQHNGLYRTADGGRRWRLISGDVGQMVVMALAQNSVDPQVLYAGTLDGVYRSDDGGGNWHLTSGGQGQVFVQALAVGGGGERIYAGAKSGLYLSEDAGATWRRLKEEAGDIAIFCVVLDPHSKEQIYAGSWGHNILRSNDGGQTWAPIHRGLETLSVPAFAVDPADPRMLYAGTVEAVYRSADGGESWQASPLAGRPLTTFALAVDPSNPGTIYAGTTEGLYRSVDSARTWRPMGSPPLAATITALALVPGPQPTLYAGTEHNGLYRSSDGGQHWQSWGLAGASVYAILIDQAGTVWVGTDRGIFRL